MDKEKPPEKGSAMAGKAFKNVFGDLLDLLEGALEDSNKAVGKTMPPDFEAKLSLLESQVEEFCAINDAIAARARLGQEAELRENPLKNFKSDEVDLYHRSQDLLLQAEEKMKELQKEEEKRDVKSESSAENIQKKLKRVSSRKGWQKL